MIKNGTLIKCEKCGREIESKMGRTLCIKCANLRDKEMAAERRNNPEYKAIYNEKYGKNRR